HGDKAMAEIEIERKAGEPARASVLVLDGAFRPFAVKEVALMLANPAAGIEPFRIDAVPAGDSPWRIEGLRIPVAGRCTLRVRIPVRGGGTLRVDILVSDLDRVSLEAAATLPRVP